MALLAAMVGVFGLLRPEELADHGGHSLWSKCWQFVSLFYCKTSQKLGHLMYTETEDGNRRPGDCFSFCACHVWHWLHLFWGKSNPGVMPVGGICSHWPPFSRMQVSSGGTADRKTEAWFLMFRYRHFKAKHRNKTIHFAHHLRCGLSGIQFVWWRPRGPLTCKQLHDSSRANWRQQLVGCKWCRSQWSRWWGTTVFGATGLQHPGTWDLFWIGPGYISYIVWLLTTCAVAACKRWTRSVFISNWSNWSNDLFWSHDPFFIQLPHMCQGLSLFRPWPKDGKRFFWRCSRAMLLWLVLFYYLVILRGWRSNIPVILFAKASAT